MPKQCLSYSEVEGRCDFNVLAVAFYDSYGYAESLDYGGIISERLGVGLLIGLTQQAEAEGLGRLYQTKARAVASDRAVVKQFAHGLHYGHYGHCRSTLSSSRKATADDIVGHKGADAIVHGYEGLISRGGCEHRFDGTQPALD